MEKKIVFHIGPAKTGTSSLQEALFQNRRHLHQQGYEYPEFGRHTDMQLLPGHHGIPEQLKKQGKLSPALLDSLAALPDTHTLVLSSENLAHVPSPAIRAMLEQIGTQNVEVIYYARRWDHLLPSVWQELVKHGFSRPYPEFLNNQVSAPMASIYLNYMNALDKWAQIVGPRRLRIFSYNNILESGEDVVAHFSREVLGQTLNMSGPRSDNQRQSPGETETLRVLNRLTYGSKIPSAQLRYAFDKCRGEIAGELEALEQIYEPHLREARPFPPFLFAHVERAFLKQYGNRVENLTPKQALFNDRDVRNAPYIDCGYLLQPGVAERFQKLLKVLSRA
ncbi:hypothetical protein K3727_21535 (plasmid) [Rhodobacteraceae bacterium M382]|nr:hypothetical protein K3727_21535 [Rhodobacteraceae bacterium M382]